MNAFAAIFPIAVLAFASIGAIAMVGKPRKPLTAGQALFSVALHCAVILCVLHLWSAA